MPRDAVITNEIGFSLPPFRVFQYLSVEFQVAFLSTCLASVRDHIARGEAACHARSAHQATPVLFCMVQHVLVEAVCGQVFAASAAREACRFVCAGDALFRFCLECPWIFHFFARCADVAGCATQAPIPQFSCSVVPLRYRKFVLFQSLAADSASLLRAASDALGRYALNSTCILLLCASLAGVAGSAAEEPAPRLLGCAFPPAV